MSGLRCIICGMKIDERNYNFNYSGIINKNDRENIVTCPFCGVAADCLTLEEDTYFNTVKDIDSVTLKILDHAMKLEVFNGEFYREAASLASKESLKNMFEALSKIELMHARVHQKLGGFEKLPVLQKIDYSKLNSDSILIESARKREEHAIAYYSKYINDLCDDRIKTVFNALSAVEKEHIDLTFM